MVNRFVEIVALALLIVLTIGTVFQWLNYGLLREVHSELLQQRSRPITVAAAPSPQPQTTITGVPAAAQPAHVSATPPPQPQQPHQPVYQPQLQQPQYQPAQQVITAQEPPVAAAAAPPPRQVATGPERTQEQPRPRDPEPPAEVAPPVAAVDSQPSVQQRSQPRPAQVDAPPPREFATPAPPPEPARPSINEQWEQHGPLVRQIITQLFEGLYNPVVERFTATFGENMPRDLLARIMDNVRDEHGTLDHFGQGSVADQLVASDIRTFRVEVATTAGSNLLFSVSLTPDDQIDGLMYKPID